MKPAFVALLFILPSCHAQAPTLEHIFTPIWSAPFLSRVYEQKVAAVDLEAVKILKGISPVAWRNVNLIGNFDFTTSSSLVDIEAQAARYRNEDFWRRSMTEGEGDGPQSESRQFYL